jgi:hypothetical protein
MITVTVKNNVKMPKINLQPYLETIADRIIIPDLVMGITAERSIDGGSLPKNDPKTIARKGSSAPLIATGTLISSFFYRAIGKSKVLISIDNIRKEIGGYLQAGIQTKSGLKQYKFFGISKDAEDSAIQYIKDSIDAEIKIARNS